MSDDVTMSDTSVGTDNIDFSDLDFSVEETPETIEPKAKEEPEIKEEKETTEESSDTEDSSEETKEETQTKEPEELPEVTELKAKAEKAERRLRKAAEKIREAEMKVTQAEERVKTLIGEGINAEVAKEIVVARKVGNYGKMFELIGFDANAVVAEWAKALGWTQDQEEEVKIHVKRKQAEEEMAARRKALDEEKARVEQEKSVTIRKDLTLKAANWANKVADKFPVIATLEDKGIDQLRDTVAELVQSGDPRIKGCKTFEEALKVAAPIVERKLYKESLKAYEAVKKIKERMEKAPAKSEPQKKEPEAKKPEKTEKESKGKSPQGNGKPAPTPKSKLTAKDKLELELSKLDFSMG